MKKFITIITFILTSAVFAQTEDAWVYFTDKPDADYYLNNPLEMLSQRALDRREAQGIELDITDVPIHQDYIDQVENATGITVKAKSKWFNCVHVRGTVGNIQNLLPLDFVDHIEYANNDIFSHAPQSSHPKIDKWKNIPDKSPEDFNYGSAYNQVHMIRADYLHQLGYTGEGMIIAILDGGFEEVNTLEGFARIRNNNQILGTYNFVNDTENVYSGTSSHHGTMVLSTIAGYLEGTFAGTAPDADFYLFVTEDVTAEYILEESNWVEAAEKADSLGVDVINTSLGYSWFDNSATDHTYSDMNGHTTFISRGAEMLSSKGVILCNSAGNSGDNSWHYITAPADADGILTVGAVYADETITGFSSYGPTSDGRVKPDVCAQGGSSAVIYYDGSPDTASGTSFSSPITCGAVACFWQAFPWKTNLELMQIIRESADRYDNPDDHYGYGIPDFEWAYNQTIGVNEIETGSAKIYPNPVVSSGILHIDTGRSGLISLEISDLSGKILVQASRKELEGKEYKISGLDPGMYFVTLKNDRQKTSVQKLIVK